MRTAMIGFGGALLILAVIVLIFGAKLLPQVGHSVGQMVKNYKRASRGNDEITVREIEEIPAKPAEPVLTEQSQTKDDPSKQAR